MKKVIGGTNGEPLHKSRRGFLKKIGGTGAAALAMIPIGMPANAATSNKAAAKEKAKGLLPADRVSDAFQIRLDAAARQRDRPPVTHPTNGDETRYPELWGNFSKALPHNGIGEVEQDAYEALLLAVTTGDPRDYDAIPLGASMRLANPQAANSFLIEGCDSHSLTMPAAPALSSYAAGGEILEVYWQAVLRELHFSEYRGNDGVSAAVRELRRFPQFRHVGPVTLFRGETKGDAVGPYISQFLLKPIPFGATTIEQKFRVPLAGDDHITSYPEWLGIQNGAAPTASNSFDPTQRHIRNGRDLGEYVHQDTPSQAYYGAALIMLGWGDEALSNTNPYHRIANQDAFVQFGAPHVIDMVTRAAVLALKCAWFQKWKVHRRLRPEAFGGIVHNKLSGFRDYPFRMYLKGSAALASAYQRHGTYLLPMAYPEGSPVHPAYPAGHATVAGACSTILKAFFNEGFRIPSPVMASADGLSLEPFVEEPLTIGNEINKLAANISLGRDFAGVHWRSDGIEGIRLGEQIAIELLSDYAETYSEKFKGFRFRKFDGTMVTI